MASTTRDATSGRLERSRTGAPERGIPGAQPSTTTGSVRVNLERLLTAWQWIVVPPGAEHYERASSAHQREKLRRAKLTAVFINCAMFTPLLLLAQSQVDGATAGAVLGTICLGVCVLVVNRLGYHQTAAMLSVLGVDLVIEGALLLGTHTSGLSSAWLQTFDLFVLPLTVTSMLLPSMAIWVVAALHIGLILGDYYLLPHTADLTAMVHQWNGDSTAFARPMLLQVVGAIFCAAMVRSVTRAIWRADRAEEIALLEHQVAEQKQQLESGVREILTTLVRNANGDRTVRVRLQPNNLLWQVSVAINTMLSRLQRAERAVFTLQRTEDEIHRLVLALDDADAGRRPIWPAPSGTPADALVERFQRQRSRPRPASLTSATLQVHDPQ